MLCSAGVVLFCNGLYGLAVDTEQFGGTFGQSMEVMVGEELFVSLIGMSRGLVAVVPHEVHVCTHTAELLLRGRIFDSIRKSTNDLQLDTSYDKKYELVQRRSQEMKTTNHAVFQLTYHLVLVSKYRKNVFTEELLEKLEDIFERLLERWECELLEFGGEADHVHLLISSRPEVQPSKLVNNLKTVSSRLVRRDYGEYLSGFYEKNVMWSRSYCLLSSGGAPIETVRSYIEAQSTT